MHILHRTLNLLIAAVWLVNGLICKVLDAVPLKPINCQMMVAHTFFIAFYGVI